MKLNLQRFSGGSYDYKCYIIDENYVGKMFDKELDDLMKDIGKLTHDLEWWQSCDYDEEDYRKTVKEFKDKWFKQNREDRLKVLINESLEELKKELNQMIG